MFTFPQPKDDKSKKWMNEQIARIQKEVDDAAIKMFGPGVPYEVYLSSFKPESLQEGETPTADITITAVPKETFVFDPQAIAMKCVERLTEENYDIRVLPPTARGRLVVVIESEVRKAFQKHLEGPPKDTIEEATKRGFGDLGNPGPNG